MMSTENCQKVADLIMERRMADLCSENDGIIPCASTILKLTIDGHEQRKTLHTLLVDATSLYKSIRRSFNLTRIVRNRMVQVLRVLLHDPKSYLISSKKQVCFHSDKDYAVLVVFDEFCILI